MTTQNERRLEILHYVDERQRAKQNTTKAKVIGFMKEKKFSSRETTLNLINDLIKEGKLNKEEINSQVHFLTINHENEFNKIFREFTEIQLIILRMFDNYMVIHDKKEISREGPYKYLNSVIGFHFPLIIDIMLHVLLVQISKKINNQIDKEILYSKVITLIDQMSSLPLSIRSVESLDEATDQIKKMMAKKSVKDSARDIGIKLIAIDDLLTKADNFKKNFMR